MKMEPTVSSETLAIRTQTAGNYPKRNKLQVYSTYVDSIQWGGKRRSGYEISHVLCRMGGVGTWVLLLYAILG